MQGAVGTFAPQTAPQQLRIHAVVAGPVEELGEEVVGVGAQGPAQGDPCLGMVAGRPGDPARQGQRCGGVLRVRGHAPAGEGAPDPEHRRGIGTFHPFRGVVARGAVLQAEDDGRRLVGGDEVVVPRVALGAAGHGPGVPEPLHEQVDQVQRLPAHRLAARAAEDAGDEVGGGRVQRRLLLLRPAAGERGVAGFHLPQRPAHLDAGVGGGRGHDRGAGQGQWRALRRAAACVGAAVGPEPAVRDAQGLVHGHVQASTGQAQALGERTEPLHHVPAGFLGGAGVLAEEEDDAVGPGAALAAAHDEGLRELVADVGPFVGRRDAEPDPAAEAAALAVQGEQHDAVGGVEAQQVGEGVGEFGRAAERDLRFRPGVPRFRGRDGRAGRVG